VYVTTEIISNANLMQQGDFIKVFLAGQVVCAVRMLPCDIRTALCHCVTFVFSKLRDKTYLRFSCDSPSYILSHTFYIRRQSLC